MNKSPYRKYPESRLLASFLALLMVFFSAPYDILASANDPDPRDNITNKYTIDSTKLAELVNEGVLQFIPKVKLGDNELTDYSTVKNGDTLSLGFEFKLAEGASVDESGKLVTRANKDTMTNFYTLDTKTGEITVDMLPNFNSEKNIYNDRNLEGFQTYQVTLNVNKNNVDDDGKFDLTFLGKTLHPTLASDVSMSLSKTADGSIKKVGDEYYQDFKVTGSLQQAADGLTIKDFYHINGNSGTQTYTFDSINRSSIKLIDSSNGDIAISSINDNVENGVLTLSGFNKSLSNFTLTYSAKLNKTLVETVLGGSANPANYNNKQNTVKVYDKNGAKISESTTALELKPPTLSKSGSYDKNANIINWTVTFDPGTAGLLDSNLPESLTVTDEYLGKNQSGTGEQKTYTAQKQEQYDGSVKYTVTYQTDTTDIKVAAGSSVNVYNKAKVNYQDKDYTATAQATVVGDSIDYGTEGLNLTKSGSVNGDEITWTLLADIPEKTSGITKLKIDDKLEVGYYPDYGKKATIIGEPSDSTFSFSLIDSENNQTPISYSDLLNYIPTYETWVNNVQMYKPNFKGYKDAYTQIDTTNGCIGFYMELNDEFIKQYGGQTLKITYVTEMEGEVTDTYVNGAEMVFYDGNTQIPDKKSTKEIIKSTASAEKSSANAAWIDSSYNSQTDTDYTTRAEDNRYRHYPRERRICKRQRQTCSPEI